LLFQPQGEEGQLQFILGESQERYIVLLGEDSSFSHWQGHQLQATLHLPFHWVKGQVYGIEFVSLDQKVFCRVNGRDLIFSQEGGKEVPYYRSSSIQADSFSFRILELAFQNLEGKLLDIRVAYDLRYTSSMDYVLDWHLGEEEYFVCGDHSSKSNDSRVWQKTFIQVQEEQGWREYQGQIEEQTDSVDFFDCFGRHRRYPYSELRIGKTVPAPVVPARYFLGKAWCIWWPPQRIQLIR
jgi:hypothetical protein